MGGARTTYAIGSGSKLEVRARSSLHDTVTVWDKLTGTVEVDPETLATTGAQATFEVDMTAFDAGDRLKNAKLRGDFAMADHPRATFTLGAIEDLVRDGDRFTATARGTLRWRGKEVALVLGGKGELGPRALTAQATFGFDIRQVGLKAPRFLFFKMDDEVTVTVTLKGTAR